MNQPAPIISSAEQHRREQFGRALRDVRQAIFAESIRKFATRVEFSPGWLARLEKGEVGVPPRSTIETLAARAGIKPNRLIAAAGLVPDDQEQTAEVVALASAIAELEPEQRQIAAAFVRFIREQKLTTS